MAHPVVKSDALDDGESDTKNLIRYARGRVAYFWMRQGLTCAGACALAILIDPLLGLIACGIVLAGETLDCFMLKYIKRQLELGAEFSVKSRLATASATAQASAISISVAFAWLGAETGAATHFSMVFLLAASLNAGIVWPYHPPSAKARLSVYGATAVLGFLRELSLSWPMSQEHLFDILGHVLLVYLVIVILKFVLRSHSIQTARKAEILAAKEQLETAHAKLKASEKTARRLALVARYANDSVVISDTSQRILWVNRAFEEMTGYTSSEALGRIAGDLLNGPETDQETVARLAQSVAEGEPFRGELLNYTKDGQEFWVETNLVPVESTDQNEEIVIAIERDISHLKEHEAELAKALSAAERGERAKSEFLATMSHEIRTPMNSVIGLSDLLTECELDETAMSYATTIRGSAEGLLTILDDVLDLSKLDAGKLTIDSVPFSPKHCIDQCAQLFEEEANRKGIFLDVIEDQKPPRQVVGDDGRLRQILVNLIGNAVKFTEKGGITVRTDYQAQPHGYILKVSIKDTGIGIAPGSVDKIFDRFSQADGKTTREFGGTGLGLTISRILARRMGGDIHVRSEEGVGSEFTLTVTLARSDNSMPERAQADPVGGNVPPLRILVAEDNKTNRFLIEKYLKDTSSDVTFASDGQQAVEYAITSPPDVILMDLSMPKLDGLEATRIIRKDAKRQPHIVALTANAFASDKQACFDAGMNDFLAKPVRKGELLGVLAQVSGATT